MPAGNIAVLPVTSARSAGPGVPAGTPLPPVQLAQLPGTFHAPAVGMNWQMAPGADGVTLLDGADGALIPTALVAVTVKVYGVPGVRPDTTMGLDAAVPVSPLGEDVAVKAVMAAPPLNAGVVNDNVALALPGIAVPMVGALGMVAAGPPIKEPNALGPDPAATFRAGRSGAAPCAGAPAC